MPKSELPAESNGYTVSRTVYRPDGSPADLRKVRQTDLFIVVIKGKRTDASRAARTLVVDLLPAGFEIENANAGGQSSWNFDWLKGLIKSLQTPGYSGMCWGYNFDWQSRIFFCRSIRRP